MLIALSRLSGLKIRFLGWIYHGFFQIHEKTQMLQQKEHYFLCN